MLLEAYQTSGRTKNQWCKDNRVGLSTLQRWLYQEKNTIKPQSLQNWIAVVPTVLQKPKNIELQLGKCIIPIDRQTDLDLLESVLRVLVKVC